MFEGSSHRTEFTSTTPATNTDYYIEFTKDGNDHTIRITTNSDYTGGETQSITYGGVENLRYFGCKARGDTQANGGNAQGTIKPDIGIWNGVTSVDSSPATWTQMAPILGLGMFCGGNLNPPRSAAIDYITIATTGNSSTFGDLTYARYSMGSVNSETRAIIGSGSAVSGNSVGLDYITTASPSNATVFGDATVARNYAGGVSNNTRGCWGGGYSSSNSNVIDYVTIATTGDATDFGDLATARRYVSAVSSDTRGIWGGGTDVYPTRTIQYITIANTGTATSSGDLLVKNQSSGTACESDTRGVFMGGDSYPSGHIASMDYLTMASLASAGDFGDLSSTRNYPAACSSGTRGVIGGGIVGTAKTNIMEYITIATTGNATDFGDLQTLKYAYSGTQGS